MGHLLPFQPLSADYPNHLIAAEPEQLRLPPARWLLLLLVLLCLVPRAVVALRTPSICIDGAVYVNSAQALEAGNFHVALMEGAINLYPVILMLLHRLGLEWEVAAALWGVTISSLVVLPLWGWVRRQFDDRVALVACLLYVVHPKFIIESPEVMRDPTFWFLFTLAIYCMWRAVTEVRYGYFIATGAAITLASLTRVEGLFLLILLAMWTFWRCAGAADGAKKAAGGRDVVRAGLSGAVDADQRGMAVRSLGLDDHSPQAAGPHPAVGGIAVGPRTDHGGRRKPRAAEALRPDALEILSHDDAGTGAGVRALDVWRHVGVAADVGPPRQPGVVLHRHGHPLRHLGAVVVRQLQPPLCLADRVVGRSVCRPGTIVAGGGATAA